jgi:hypothetical protein
VKKAIWLSYDLGVQGDYESLYQWLDSRGAIECGDSLAFFQLVSDGTPIPDQVKKDLEGTIKADSKARIYIIWRQENSVKGKFIFGQHKAPPWSGYAPKPSAEESEGA